MKDQANKSAGNAGNVLAKQAQGKKGGQGTGHLKAASVKAFSSTPPGGDHHRSK